MAAYRDSPGHRRRLEQVVADYEAAHPDVTIEMQFLENEAFKAKLTTLLQSDARPDIFYSWGGGVLKVQIEAGVLRDIDDLMRGEWEETLSPAAVNAFTYDGKVYGTPHLVSQVGFWYNKALFAKAGLNADDIKTWDDLLGAVQKLKTPASRRSPSAGRTSGRCISTGPIWPSVSAARRLSKRQTPARVTGLAGRCLSRPARSSNG